jgi:hypothetical protein
MGDSSDDTMGARELRASVLLSRLLLTPDNELEALRGPGADPSLGVEQLRQARAILRGVCRALAQPTAISSERLEAAWRALEGRAQAPAPSLAAPPLPPPPVTTPGVSGAPSHLARPHQPTTTATPWAAARPPLSPVPQPAPPPPLAPPPLAPPPLAPPPLPPPAVSPPAVPPPAVPPPAVPPPAVPPPAPVADAPACLDTTAPMVAPLLEEPTLPFREGLAHVPAAGADAGAADQAGATVITSVHDLFGDALPFDESPRR